MNTETREIRPLDGLTDEEKASGQWIPVRRKYAKQYEQKEPITDADFARIVEANKRRLAKAARRLAAQQKSDAGDDL